MYKSDNEHPVCPRCQRHNDVMANLVVMTKVAVRKILPKELIG